MTADSAASRYTSAVTADRHLTHEQRQFQKVHRSFPIEANLLVGTHKNLPVPVILERDAMTGHPSIAQLGRVPLCASPFAGVHPVPRPVSFRFLPQAPQSTYASSNEILMGKP